MINVGSAAVPVSKMLPVGDKLWCSCHNTVKIFDTVALQFQVRDKNKKWFTTLILIIFASTVVCVCVCVSDLSKGQTSSDLILLTDQLKLPVCGVFVLIRVEIVLLTARFSRRFQRSFAIGGDPNRSVTNMAASGAGVWLSLQNSAVLRLVHPATCEVLAEVNTAPAVTKMLSGKPFFPSTI